MSDIVERLREWARVQRADAGMADDITEAADEITRLRERIAHLERVQEAARSYEARAERYRKALEELVAELDNNALVAASQSDWPRLSKIYNRARAALRGEG